MTDNIIRISPQQYIHVLNTNSNITRLEQGPQIFVKKDEEQIVQPPTTLINLQSKTFIRIRNPVKKDKDGEIVLTDFGQVANNFGQDEIRTDENYSEPFPLYPCEVVVGGVEKQTIVLQNTAIRFLALYDFKDGAVQRFAGEEYQVNGPFTYVPRVEEVNIGIIVSKVIKSNQALLLRATRKTIDVNGVERLAGEQWLIRKTGSYLPGVNENIESLIQGDVLTDKVCLQLRAKKNFTDIYGVQKLAGSEWLVTNKQTQVHIVDVHEQKLSLLNSITLSSRQYCVILNPFCEKKGTNLWGIKKQVIGECTFFLQPFEDIENNKIQDVKVLGENQALLLKANEDFQDSDGVKRFSGTKWMIKGPREYIQPCQADILEERQCIPLDENEGIYVRDNNTGEVVSKSGQTYLLQAHESLWEKELSQKVEELVQEASQGVLYKTARMDANNKLVYASQSNKIVRDKTRMVTFKAPHNSVVQLYDFKLKKNRVVFGPDLVMLGPDENFTVVSLSGGRPKLENQITSISLSLGPDFMSDIFEVETSDHARISLQLAYNWHFQLDKTSQSDIQKIFSVKDFIGDACKSIASRVRGTVSSVTFEDFHHHSGLKIREAVFGKAKDGSCKEVYMFPANNLVISSVDIQNMEVTDKKTRENLSQSINIAIEIASKSQEMASQHKAKRIDQEAMGQLQRQRLEDATKSEESKIKLLKLQALSLEVQNKGEATAKANAQAFAALIDAETQVKQAEFQAQAKQIEAQTEFNHLKANHEFDLEVKRSEFDLEITKARELAEIELKKFKEMVDAIGKETLISISKAGPEMKAKMLGGLGLKGYLVTDGKNPINLFNTANGFMGGAKQ